MHNWIGLFFVPDFDSCVVNVFSIGRNSKICNIDAVKRNISELPPYSPNQHPCLLGLAFAQTVTHKTPAFCCA